jgi:MFS family permease
VDRERTRHVLLVAVILTQLLVVIDFFALNLTLPPMAADFDVSPLDLQFVISGYMIALGAFMIPAGRLADIVGRRKVTVTGVVVFGATSLACGLAPDESFVLGFRFVQGIGAALCFPVSIAMVTAAFPPAEVQRKLGLVYGFAAFGTALGPLVGGLLAEASWRWVFLLNVPLAAVVTLLLLAAGPEPAGTRTGDHMDWLGVVLVAGGLVLTTFGVDKADDWGWSSVRVLGLITAGLAILVVFFWIEAHRTEPLLDLALFRNGAYSLIVAAGVIANSAYCIAVFGATLYLQNVRGLSPARAALVFLALAGGAAVAGQLAGHLDKMRPDWVSAMALAVGGGALILLTVSASLAVYVPAFALVGVGLGLGWSYASVGTQVVVAPKQAAMASGVTLTALVAVGGVAVALAATAIDQLAGAAGVRTADPIDDVVRVCAAVCLVGAIAVLAVGRLVIQSRPATVVSTTR